jgi:putative oxidoreductase
LNVLEHKKGDAMCEKFFAKHGYLFLFIARLLFGVLFLAHGLMKFGVIGANVAPAFGLYWFAGVIEIAVGVLVALGLFTRYAASFGALHMVMAWVIGHVPKGWNPFANGGEVAVLFFAGFLLIAVLGSGKLGLDAKFRLQ